MGSVGGQLTGAQCFVETLHWPNLLKPHSLVLKSTV